MDILLKYWKPVGVLLLIVLIFTAWHFDRAEKYRLRHYAAAQNRSRNLPATTTAAAASDGASDSQGWLLFGQCAEKYAGLAETADGHAADLREWQAYGHAVSSQRAE